MRTPQGIAAVGTTAVCPGLGTPRGAQSASSSVVLGFVFPTLHGMVPARRPWFSSVLFSPNIMNLFSSEIDLFSPTMNLFSSEIEWFSLALDLFSVDLFS